MSSSDEGLTCFRDQARVCGADCAAYIVESPTEVSPLPCVLLRSARETPAVLKRILTVLERSAK